MNFKFTEDEQSIVDMISQYAAEKVAPRAHDVDEKEEFPVETWKELADMGMFGIAFDTAYEGQGMSFLTYAVVCEKLAEVCGTTSVMVAAHTSLCAWPISYYGTEEQKKKYLTELASGRKLGAFGLTEPNAGSDAGGTETTAVDKGDHWLLNGSKIFITNAGYAEIFVVFAATDKSKGTRGGITAFIVEKSDAGFTVGPHEKKMGIKGSSTCQLFFEDCKIPKDRLLGTIGEGFKIAMKTLDGGRVSIGAQALGIAQGAINECIKYVKERVQFGKRISQFQNTQFELADMQTKVNAARFLLYKAARCKDEDDPELGFYSAQGKLFASEVASDVTRRCLQLVGGMGYTREFPFERFMRDAKITEIYEGTSEVQKIVISAKMGIN